MRPLIATLLLAAASIAHAESVPLYVGTGGNAIYLTQFDSETGSLTAAREVAQTARPTFICIHRPTRSLYSICEVQRDKGAAIVAWEINPKTGKLSQRSSQDAMGDGPCFVATASNGKYAAIANYGGGSVALFPIAKDGSVAASSGFVQHVGSSVNPRRQTAPHAHSSRFDPTDQRVAVADLGTDKVYLYDIAHDGSLNPSSPAAIDAPAGSGPRHFVFSPDQRYMLILGELSGTITSVRYAPPNVQTVETISTMAAGTPDDAPRGSAEILFHPNGRFVYCSNRGPSEIACFVYNARDGRLKRTSAISSGGVHPRNFRISPDGKFMLVANQNTNNIVVFSINADTGQLTPTGTQLEVDKPMCLKFFPG